jgi:predicted GTPase
VAVCATRIGAGKSQTSRYLAGLIDNQDVRVVVVRHPMPYGDLGSQAVQRMASLDDLNGIAPTIEEREEYEPHLEAGHVVYAGVDYAEILQRAEDEADLIIWDGGNNDMPFFQPDLVIVVADPLRPDDGARYHPGEANLRMADVVIINKVDAVEMSIVEAMRSSVAELNPYAKILTARSELSIQGNIAGRRVVVVEDGPTLTHGGMRYGAGTVAARRFGAAAVVDPRPAAVGSIAEIMAAYPTLEPLVPAMGYSPEQVSDLEQTLNAVDADLVLSGTPIDIAAVVRLNKPVVRVRYDIVQVSGEPLAQLVAPLMDRIGEQASLPLTQK